MGRHRGQQKSNKPKGAKPGHRSDDRQGHPSPHKNFKGGPKRPQRDRDFGYSEDYNLPIKNVQSFLQSAERATEKAIAQWLTESESLLASRGEKREPTSLMDSLDPWQLKVYTALEGGQNIVVDAPTTAGKTRAVETYFKEHINNPDFRAAYTTPVKSLSNDKVREFREMFGRDKVGIATGDIKENLSAPIVVTTLETYRNSLLGVEPDLNRTLVVFDEYHFMQDESRGSAWEEAIILTPHSCQLLLMSASVENAPEFVSWLEKIHNRSTIFVQTLHRPVPLTNIVYFQDRWILASELPPKVLEHFRKGEALPIPHKLLAPRLVELIEQGLSPCIVYAGRRKSTESIVFELSKVLEPLPEAQRAKIGELLMKEQAETKALSFLDPKLRSYMQTYGIAYHHSGMAPPVRVAIESILKQGLLRFCAATMGLSIGINFSVRSALISDYQRPGERGMSRYSPSEILQMLGRAGRRGRDVIGFSLWPNVESFARQSSAKRDRCDSRLKNDPTTFLGLVGQGMDAKDIENFYAKSFRRFGDSGIDLGLIRRNRIESRLGTRDLPCTSPAHEFALFHHTDNKTSKCHQCPYRQDCHRYIETKGKNDLAALHIHLHDVGALDPEDKLSSFGEFAKYFPQTGGMVLARHLHDEVFTERNLSSCAELIAGICLARFKTPNIDGRYKFPFNAEKLEEELEDFYPISLFPELYDEPFGRRNYPVLREFNPDAGYVIKEWLSGMPWKELARTVTNEKFAQGDLISLIYRVASYMQSLVQAHHPQLSKLASRLRDELLREPLSISL